MIKNDGSNTVTLEYGLEGRSERTKLSIKGNQAVEIDSKGPLPVELYVDGKRVASEKKGNRTCASATPVASDQPTVVVRPLDARDNATVVQPVYVQPQVVYAAPYYDPFWYGPALSVSLGWGRPYYYPYYYGRGYVRVVGRGRH
jgi:hypothetical protein